MVFGMNLIISWVHKLLLLCVVLFISGQDLLEISEIQEQRNEDIEELQELEKESNKLLKDLKKLI